MSALKMTLFITQLLALASITRLSAADVELYINQGLITYSQGTVTWVAFNESSELSANNATLELSPGVEITIEVHNLTDALHTFTIDGVIEEDNELAAGSSSSFTFSLTQSGCYRYYSNVPHGAFAGASGIISVGGDEYDHYHWNLFELNIALSEAFATGGVSAYPEDYKPELFMISGLFYPNTQNDMSVKITGMVGQTFYINVINSGYMDQAMHFHGFHVEIVSSRLQPERAGWIKDSFPVKQGDAMRLKLFLDKPGMYPVHNHNLIAVTNLGLYPGGMMTHIEVMP